MDLYFIECFMFTKNKNIEVKRKIDKKKKIFTLFALADVLKSSRPLMKKKLAFLIN